MIKFKLDENLHPDVGPVLQKQGHDVATVWGQGPKGHPDPEIAQLYQAENRVLITLDNGFGDIRMYPPEQCPGLIVLQAASQSRDSILALCRRVLPLLETEPLAGRLWIVDESAVRMRGGGRQ